MSDMIPLTKDGGLDPRLTYCPRCGGECNEIIVGDNRLITHSSGQKAIAPRGKTSKVMKQLGWSRSDCQVGMVPEGRLPATQPCDSCNKELEEWGKIVADGGVYWQCASCDKTGVVLPSEFANLVRAKHGIDPPGPCGVEFMTCDEHDDG